MSIIGVDFGTASVGCMSLERRFMRRLRRPGRNCARTCAPPGRRGQPGDLLVMVHSRPDARFERRGADLWRAETIPVPDAVLGATRQVPTLEGSAEN